MVVDGNGEIMKLKFEAIEYISKAEFIDAAWAVSRSYKDGFYKRRARAFVFKLRDILDFIETTQFNKELAFEYVDLIKERDTIGGGTALFWNRLKKELERRFR